MNDPMAKDVSGELMQKTVSSLRQPPLVFIEDTKEEALTLYSSQPPTLAKRTMNLEAETLNAVLLFIDQLPHRIAAAAASHNTTAAALVSDMHRGIDAAAGAKGANEVASVARLRSLLADAARATGITTDIIAEQLHEAVAGASVEAVNLKTTTTAADGPAHQLGGPKRDMPNFGSAGTAVPIVVDLMQTAKGKLKAMKSYDN
ncbi:hypothetical protein SLS55_004584 [Diplodia seriata]|uniref:Uncharacterized protein n=1 Tax=Diplodia seriata TaxID=420778 RepID=A0ABR3CJT3_9PEZI